MTATPTQPAPAPSAETAAGDSQAVVRCVGLTKIFRDFWLRNRVTAVDHIELDIRRGEVFGLLGPNGSGKSTTIKMILGLLHPTAGRIAVFGRLPRDVQIKERIGYLPEESYLYKFLTARETLDYYARLFHQHRGQRRRRIDQLLEYVGLDKAANRAVGEFSKGMQRRIGLAQALINDPELLILDEPTTGMDPIGTRQIKDLILDLKQRGKTILLCSHLLADVEDVTDRVAVMFGGKVREHGTIGDLLVQQGMTTIRTEALPEEAISEIEALLTKYGKHIDRVDHPRQKLEELFLDIVHRAQSEGVVTSGAGSGGKLAAFLSGSESDAEGEAEAAPEEVLSKLVQPEAKPEPAPEPKASGEPASRQAPAPAGDQAQPPREDREALDALLEPKKPTPPPQPEMPEPRPASAPQEQKRKSDEDVDANVLDDLLGGDKK